MLCKDNNATENELNTQTPFANKQGLNKELYMLDTITGNYSSLSTESPGASSSGGKRIMKWLLCFCPFFMTLGTVTQVSGIADYTGSHWPPQAVPEAETART